ncbi:MAG: glycerophosphodiester phosphodiesterase [Chloroflexota bacterium]
MTSTMRDRLYAGQTMVFGHRGASADAPMNTIPAFELAATYGAEGVELDIHGTADGYAVVIHDRTVDATTDGSGYVNRMNLKQLRRLDAGAWKDARFAGTRIPTLDEVFEAVGQRLLINVEIKAYGLGTDGIEQHAADIIRRHRMESRVIVSSFNPLALRRFHRLLPDVPLGFLSEARTPAYVHLFTWRLPLAAQHPGVTMVTTDYIRRAQARRRAINTWTVNDAAQARMLRDMGVAIIITDQPDVIRAGLMN